MLEPLRQRAFLWLWLGQGVSAVGDGIFLVALPVFLLRGARPSTDLGFVLAAQSLASVVFVFAGGLLADRYRRTMLMAMADGLRAVAVIALMLAPQTAPLAALMALAAIVGVGQAIFAPSYRALIPSLVSETQLQSANALIATSARVASIVGSAIGGVVIAAAGPSAGFAVDGATFVVSAGTLIGLLRFSIRRPDSAVRRSLAHEAMAGLRELWRRPWVGAIIGQGAAQVLLVHAPMAVLIPLYLRAQHELNYLGLMYSAQGIGAVAGAIAAAKIRPKEPGTAALLVLLVGLLPLTGMLLQVPVGVLVVGMAVGGVGGSVFSVLWAAALQAAIPSEVLGRVASLDYLGQLGLEPVGVAATPPAVGALGFDAVTSICMGSLVITTAVPFLVSGVRTLRDPSPVEISASLDSIKK